MVKKTYKKQKSGCLGMRALTKKGHEETFWTNGNVLYLSRGAGYIIVYRCQNSLNYILKMCAFHCKFYLKENQQQMYLS